MSTKETFECRGCGRTFKSAQGLAVHNYRMHSKKGQSHKIVRGPKSNPVKRKAPVAPKARILKFCPCCGVNIEVAEKALNIAQEMS